jgi:molybdopterin converting factor small subunit
MRVRVLAFARMRELLGSGSQTLELPSESTAGDLWKVLEERVALIAPLASSTRVARNGRIVPMTQTLSEGDEVALLPPVGGG